MDCTCTYRHACAINIHICAHTSQFQRIDWKCSRGCYPLPIILDPPNIDTQKKKTRKKNYKHSFALAEVKVKVNIKVNPTWTAAFLPSSAGTRISSYPSPCGTKPKT